MELVKVLHLIPTLSSGGAERQLVNVVRNTSKSRIEHVVAVIDDARFLATAIRDAGYRVIEYDISKKRPFLSASAAFRKTIAAERPDVIHSWLYDGNIAARLGNLPFHRVPMITSWQLADYEPSGIKAAGWNPSKVTALKLIDKLTALVSPQNFVACSDFVRTSYERNYGVRAASIQTIFNAVDPRTLAAGPNGSQRLRDELGLPVDATVFLNVGRLDPQKNQSSILRAYKNLIGHVTNAYLLIAGIGGSGDQLKSLCADLGIEDRVQFLGRRDDVGDLMELADVFVFPSFFEGLPVALIEAMYKSLPCIASRIDVFKEVIADNENGLLVDPNSIPEISDAMLTLYRDGALMDRLGKKAFETASTRFNSVSTAKEWEELYERVSHKSNG